MQERPIVYVNRITNLSDARYCAGMGADLLGFVVDPGHPDYVSPEEYAEMIGWISGPKRVAEILTPEACDPDTVTNRYAPDFLHLSVSEIQRFALSKIPLILEVTLENYAKFISEIDPSLPVGYIVVTGVSDRVHPPFRHTPPALVATEVFSGSAMDFLSNSGALGVVLQGSRELSPGLKDYDSLSRILEELENSPR